MSEAGHALLGHRHGHGRAAAPSRRPSRPSSSPLLETTLEGARTILLSITGGRDLSLWEVNEAAKAVQEAAHPDANIIFGAMVDEKLDRRRCGSPWSPPATAASAAARGAPALREPAGEPRVSGATAASTRRRASAYEVDVPEFIPRC